MNSLSMQGLRGGTGTTSLVVGLAHALHTLGQRVLVIDLCADNQAHLHCNLAAGEASGWARAQLDQQSWQSHAWELAPGFYLLPYGQLSSTEQACMHSTLPQDTAHWNQRFRLLRGQFDWVLFDLPQTIAPHDNHLECDLRFQVAASDMACHLRLELGPADDRLLLVNRYDPASRLQSDLLLLWRSQFNSRLIPALIHQDEAIHEALAFKMPVGQYSPDSQAADELLSLATWCLIQRGVAA